MLRAMTRTTSTDVNATASKDKSFAINSRGFNIDYRVFRTPADKNSVRRARAERFHHPKTKAADLRRLRMTDSSETLESRRQRYENRKFVTHFRQIGVAARSQIDSAHAMVLE